MIPTVEEIQRSSALLSWPTLVYAFSQRSVCLDWLIVCILQLLDAFYKCMWTLKAQVSRTRQSSAVKKNEEDFATEDL